MKKIMVILGGGGHTEQMLRLVDRLGSRFEYLYLITKDDKVSEYKIRIRGRVVRFERSPYPHTPLSTNILRLFKNIFESFFLYLKERPDAILCAGPGTAVPISIIGKIFGSKIIFIESWSRVCRPSSSGKIFYRFANLFFVQWKKLKKDYPKSIFAGRLA